MRHPPTTRTPPARTRCASWNRCSRIRGPANSPSLADLRAPAKAAVWFEHPAHLPMIEEPGRVLVALLHTVRPFAVQRAKAAPKR